MAEHQDAEQAEISSEDREQTPENTSEERGSTVNGSIECSICTQIIFPGQTYYAAKNDYRYCVPCGRRGLSRNTV